MTPKKKPAKVKTKYPKKKLLIPKVLAEKLDVPDPLKIIGGLPERQRKHYAMPKAVIQQVAEFANGGYYLVSFSHKGIPYITCNADTPSQGDALKNFCVNYFRSLNKVEKDLMDKTVYHEVITGAMRQHPGDKDNDGDGPEKVFA